MYVFVNIRSICGCKASGGVESWRHNWCLVAGLACFNEYLNLEISHCGNSVRRTQRGRNQNGQRELEIVIMNSLNGQDNGKRKGYKVLFMPFLKCTFKDRYSVSSKNFASIFEYNTRSRRRISVCMYVCILYIYHVLVPSTLFPSYNSWLPMIILSGAGD